MRGRAETMVITDVFVRYHLSGVLAIWVSSGTLWDLILGAFGVPWGAFWWLWGSWGQVGILMDFGTLPGAARIQSTRSEDAKM